MKTPTPTLRSASMLLLYLSSIRPKQNQAILLVEREIAYAQEALSFLSAMV